MEWTREATIGCGSTATVSLATATHSGELFAAKSTELSHSKYLQTEQSILSKLNSPYLVKYIGFDITRENSQFYYNLFMEYLPRGTLHDEIRRHGGRLEEAMIRRYTRDILQGLEYLHESGVVHCDIKSSNILIGEKNAKISDLGCAKFFEKVSKIGDSHMVVFSGTPMFMSPEVVVGQDQGFEADIWALGCTVIEMATGKNPWPEVHDPISALYRIGFSGESPEIPRWLSQKGRDFLEICLRRNPNDRMAAKELLKHPFFEDLEFASSSSSSSPRSVFDQSVWDSFEAMESSSDHDGVSSLNSAASRMESLIGCEPNWIWDEDWITVRSNVKEESENLCDNEGVNVILDDNISVVYGLEMSFLGVHEGI
ncbi:Mitogen-activated protein kinase kinase kinase ANP1 [Morus notabilis]|uniref:Mitogen-activated protein kinase kinase kinase ANP1 n=1 Tax=Morus notabilis TaxID=981085 RepID=W9RDI6_9ROSA|nr:Mitogen-activated protein kinase kinase kinase ANP1 [Morus notabilis]